MLAKVDRGDSTSWQPHNARCMPITPTFVGFPLAVAATILTVKC